MVYQGDGLSRQMTVNYGSNYEMTVNNRSGAFEMPALVNIGAAYDLFLTKDSIGTLLKDHRLSLNASFIANSFTYDNYLFGVEYAWKEMIMVRGGYILKKVYLIKTSVALYSQAQRWVLHLNYRLMKRKLQ
jgi:hypothetical protein